MFMSHTRPMVIPQMEHSRLAGALASHWGNANFDRPPVDFTAFVAGVTLHDWAYGPLDDKPVPGMPPAQWLTIQQRGLHQRFTDPITDVITKMHYHRLLTWKDNAEAAALAAQYAEKIEALAQEIKQPLATLQQTDTLTQFCDMLAFDFSFEEPTTRTLELYPAFGPHAKPVEVTYTIEGGRHVSVTPWPFTISRIEGSILGYQRATYPTELHPVVVPYALSAG